MVALGALALWRVFPCKPSVWLIHRIPRMHVSCCVDWKNVGMESILLGMKFSGNMPADDLEFLDQQVAAGKYRSRSAAITKAVRMLREADMQDAYVEAFADIDPIWDTTTADGLEDETW